MSSSNSENIVPKVFLGVSTLVIGYMVYSKLSQQKAAPKTLYERLGGDAAVEAAVDRFYKKVLADNRINRFFAHTNMTTQRHKQVSFMCMAFGKPGHKYTGLAMDTAHRKLLKEGMDDSHFDAVAENLQNTLLEMGVAKELVNEVITAVGGLRDQVMCRGKWAQPSEAETKKSLYERLGGDAAVEAAVDKFYAKVLADKRINHFFAHTNMTTQRNKQVAFMCMAFGKPNHKYTGLTMDAAHRKLIKEGMNDSHFDAVAENLQNTLLEMGVSKDLVNEVITAVGGLREQVMCRGKWATA